MVNSITESVLGVADKVLGKFVADKNLKMKLEHELKTQLQTANLSQISINKIEAGDHFIFLGEVLDGKIKSNNQPLVYHKGCIKKIT